MMALHKPAVALCSSCHNPLVLTHGGIISLTSSFPSIRQHQHSSSSSSSSSTSSPTQSSRTRRDRFPWQTAQLRSYATTSEPSPHHWPKSPNPTPYEILNIPRSTKPYTKHRFYELVKLYHPDRHAKVAPAADTGNGEAVPAATRLERYRLIVAANDLLSDPEKRKLYDAYGMGWTSDQGLNRNESMRHADRSWRNEPNNAAHNATWEDWERWYEARDPSGPSGRRSEPRYMSNPMFASLVVMMCMIGALAQRTRAEGEGLRYVAMKDAGDAAIGEGMRRRHMEKMGRTRDERVDMFRRDREAAHSEASVRERLSTSLPQGRRE